MTKKSLPFLQGGGEMGELIRSFDWAAHPLGAPDTWPQSLRTTLGIILHSGFPMFLFWGEELLCFYNDAFRPSLGNDGKHPAALGRPGAAVWPEIWADIKPMIDQVLEGRGATWNENQLLPIYRNGHLEDVYWTFSYSPVIGENGTPAGVFVTCTETTAQMANIRQLKESHDLLEFAIEASELATWDFNPITKSVTTNERFVDWFGFRTDTLARGMYILDAIAEEDRQRVIDCYVQALDPFAGLPFDVEFTIRPQGRPERIVNARAKTWFNADGQAWRFNGTIQDVTNRRQAEKERQTARELADIAIKSSGIGLFRVNMKTREIDFSPEFAHIVTGNTHRETYSWDQFSAHIHPEDEAMRITALRNAVQTGQFQYVPRVIWEDGSVHRMRVSGACTFDDDGRADILSGTVKDITEEEKNADALREAEARLQLQRRESDAMFRSVTNSSPTGLWLSDREGTVTYLNKTLLEWTGRSHDDLVGSGWLEAVIPEDRQRAADTFVSSVSSRSHYDVLFRIRKADGQVVWCQAAGDPYYTEDGAFAGYAGFCMDIEELMTGRQELAASEARFRNIVEQAPMAIALLQGPDMVIEVGNQKIFEVWGKDSSITGKKLLEALPEIEGQGFMELLTGVYESGVPFFGNGVMASLVRNGVLEEAYFDFAYTPIREGSGKVIGVMALATEVTEQFKARRALAESEARFRALIEQAPVATCLFVGEDMRIEVANEIMIGYWGKTSAVIGKPLLEAMPELHGQPFPGILKDIYATGRAHSEKAAFAELEVDGVLRGFYFDYTYKPVKDQSGRVYGIMNMALDVTDQVVARRKLEESELFSRSIFNNSPVAKLVLVGADMVVERANQIMLELLGNDKSIVGQPLAGIIPNLQDSGIPALLQHIYATGETIHQSEEKLGLGRTDAATVGYYNYIYKPLRNLAGNIYGIMVTATDVTEQVVARQKIEEAQESLRGAIELAQLGTWSVDLTGTDLVYSDRIAEWFGFSYQGETIAEVLASIHPDDRERISAAVAQALHPDSDGTYDAVYTVVNPINGQRRILHAQGQAVYDRDGNPVRLNGTAQDITIQRELQLALEREVMERTEELAASYEELQATNTELEETNTRLTHSNEELAQYAYVASHDLQEPLRKIRIFTGMLEKKVPAQGDNAVLIGKISQSAERMSMLIRDLLDFSRLLKSDALVRPVDLNDVIAAVFGDFELTISEKGAPGRVG